MNAGERVGGLEKAKKKGKRKKRRKIIAWNDLMSEHFSATIKKKTGKEKFAKLSTTSFFLLCASLPLIITGEVEKLIRWQGKFALVGNAGWEVVTPAS